MAAAGSTPGFGNRNRDWLPSPVLPRVLLRGAKRGELVRADV